MFGVRRARARVDACLQGVKRHFDRVRWLAARARRLPRAARAGGARGDHGPAASRAMPAGLTQAVDHHINAITGHLQELRDRAPPYLFHRLNVNRSYIHEDRTSLHDPHLSRAQLRNAEGRHRRRRLRARRRDAQRPRARRRRHTWTTTSSRASIGRDPRNIEDIWQYLYRGAYWRRGPVTMAAIAGGRRRACGTSRASLRGMPRVSAARRKKSLRARWCTAMPTVATTPRRSKRSARYLAKGFKAIRVQSGVPGLEKVYGVGKGSGYYEPAQKGLPPEEPWDTVALPAPHAGAASGRCARRTDSTSICCTTRITG